jgi:hypothetical protein
MTEPSLLAVAEVEEFCGRRNAGPETVKASGLKNIVEDAQPPRLRRRWRSYGAVKRHRPDGVTLNW